MATSIVQMMGVILMAITAALYGPFMRMADIYGLFKELPVIGQEKCEIITGPPGFTGCEDLVIHHPSNSAFLACASLRNRETWFPTLTAFNRSGSLDLSDEAFHYDLKTKKVTPLKIIGYNGILSLHGLDYFQPDDEPDTIYIYFVNHLPSEAEFYAPGFPKAASVIEVFRHKLGSFELEHVETISHPLIRTPNNVAAVGKRMLYITNDHSNVPKGIKRDLEDILALPLSDVIFWHDGKAQQVLNKVTTPNGITKGGDHPNFNNIYVSNIMAGMVRIYERQPDGPDPAALDLVDEIPVGFLGDNLSIDPSNGNIYVAGHPQLLGFYKTIEDFSQRPFAPSLVKRIANRTSHKTSSSPGQPIDKAYLGEKYVVETIYGDAKGTQISAATIAAVHPGLNVLLISGVWGGNILHCKLN